MGIVRMSTNAYTDILTLSHESTFVLGMIVGFVLWVRIVVRDMLKESGFVKCF
jgi:hypothetical protein